MSPAWIAVLVALLAALVSVAAWLLVRRRPRLRAPGRRPEAPAAAAAVVLAHGLMGFDVIEIWRRRHEYFRGIPARLEGLGARVHVVRVAPLASIAQRARQLADQVRAIPASHVHIIAHSMGGLDARYAISRLGLHARVLSLTTLGTPHRGTPLADVGTAILGDRLGLSKILSTLGLGADGLFELTTARLARFNEEVPDAPDVAYHCVLSFIPEEPSQVNPILRAAWVFLRERAGDNDGLVPVTSQRWGRVLKEVHADHWAQIGWSKEFDAPALYAEIWQRVRTTPF
jgi:triacylglycerol lipase